VWLCIGYTLSGSEVVLLTSSFDQCTNILTSDGILVHWYILLRLLAETHSVIFWNYTLISFQRL